MAANQVAARVCGLTGRSVRGRNCRQLLKESFSLVDSDLSLLMSGRGRVVAGTGADRYLITRNDLSSPFIGVSGFILQFVELGLEQMLRGQEDRRNRYQAMRGLATRMEVVAREGLASIELYASLLRRSLAGDDENEALAGRISDVVHTLTPAFDNFSSFATLPEPRPTSFAIADLVAETVARLALINGGHGGIEVEVDVGVPDIRADRGMIGQLLLNLGFNGIEHGALPLVVGVGPAVSAGIDFIRIQVRDHGQGLSPGVKERMFDPFFSTVEEAMGLGLTVCNAIVEAHGGMINGDNVSGGGAGFVVLIPRAGVFPDHPEYQVDH